MFCCFSCLRLLLFCVAFRLIQQTAHGWRWHQCVCAWTMKNSLNARDSFMVQIVGCGSITIRGLGAEQTAINLRCPWAKTEEKQIKETRRFN